MLRHLQNHPNVRSFFQGSAVKIVEPLKKKKRKQPKHTFAALLNEK